MQVLLRPPQLEEPNMHTVTTIGLDIAKSVFQVHGVDAIGPVVLNPILWRWQASHSAAINYLQILDRAC